MPENANVHKCWNWVAVWRLWRRFLPSGTIVNFPNTSRGQRERDHFHVVSDSIKYLMEESPTQALRIFSSLFLLFLPSLFHHHPSFSILLYAHYCFHSVSLGIFDQWPFSPFASCSLTSSLSSSPHLSTNTARSVSTRTTRLCHSACDDFYSLPSFSNPWSWTLKISVLNLKMHQTLEGS